MQNRKSSVYFELLLSHGCPDLSGFSSRGGLLLLQAASKG